MEAIVEFFVAIIGALIMVFVSLFQAVIVLLAILLEFLFVAVTQGIEAANQRYTQRQKEQQDRKESQEATANPQLSTDSTLKPSDPPVNSKYPIIIVLCLFVAVVGTIGLWIRHHQIQQQLVAITRSQAQTLVDKFAEQIRTDKVPAPQTGNLPDKDAWQLPLQLYVDKLPVGTLIVVRSFGPDRKRGTIDDILVIGEAHLPLKQAAGKLANRGLNVLKDRAAKLLQRKDTPTPPDDKKTDP
ncbi:MAG: hypothetical protein KDA68_14580 [Planctomycetaceae bacterium]|nr:hypothetical protein [Planctomycetaceae bacterium]